MAYARRRPDSRTWTVREGDQFFQRKGPVHETLRAIVKRLDAMGIPYAVVGGLALFQHGYRRFTEDVDLLVDRDGLERVHEELEGRGYLPKFEGARNLLDTKTRVAIEFLVSGEYPGDGKTKPVSFPDPGSSAKEIDGIRYLNLPSLIELKLASAMTNPERLRDKADVQELIKTLALPRDFSSNLNPFVRACFDELWEIENTPKRFLRRWSLAGLGTEPTSIEELARLVKQGADTLLRMAQDGVRLESAISDHAVLVTTDPDLAEKYDMHEESEFL